MSRRHHPVELAPLPRVEHRARARAERQRITAELSRLAKAVTELDTPDDATEPGAAWRPPHHRDAERAKRRLLDGRRRRHWKQKAWKRRSAQRRAEARAWLLVG
jgi:hypothetical protein